MAAWVNESGGEFFRFGMTYTLRRSEDDVGRIVVAIVHDTKVA